MAPLKSPRYEGARYIYVVIRSKRALNGARGLAYDEISLQNDLTGILSGIMKGRRVRIPVLTIALSNDIDPKKNRTPTHEYFHMVQNGMTHFKNSWFYEGMAVWSEAALGGTRYVGTLKRQPENVWESFRNDASFLEKIFSSSYQAGNDLWRPLAGLCPAADPPLRPTEKTMSFAYTDGTLVVQNLGLQGTRTMRRVLEQLGNAETLPFVRLAYEKWTEANQRRIENNVFIVDAIAEAVKETCLEPRADAYMVPPVSQGKMDKGN
ncbi:MAG: hypothetical protein LBQ10_01720 [Desulfovibrio sp.]|nr:hypothetical protein [Desulfovibrio sp.]